MSSNPKWKHLMNWKETWNGFDANPQNINRKWQPKKLVSHFNDMLKAEWYEPLKQTQLLEAFNLIFNLDTEKLKVLQKQVKEWVNMPFIYNLLLKNLNSNKWMEALEKMLDRSYWKAVQKTEERRVDKNWNDIITEEQMNLIANRILNGKWNIKSNKTAK